MVNFYSLFLNGGRYPRFGMVVVLHWVLPSSSWTKMVHSTSLLHPEGWREWRKRPQPLPSVSPWKLSISLAFTPHCLEFGHVAKLTAKEGGKCSLSSRRSHLRLKFRESIAVRKKSMQNIGKQLAAFSTAGNHSARQQVSSWSLRGGCWKRCHKRGNTRLSIEGWIGVHWVKSDQRALQAGALA